MASTRDEQQPEDAARQEAQPQATSTGATNAQPQATNRSRPSRRPRAQAHTNQQTGDAKKAKRGSRKSTATARKDDGGEKQKTRHTQPQENSAPASKQPRTAAQDSRQRLVHEHNEHQLTRHVKKAQQPGDTA